MPAQKRGGHQEPPEVEWLVPELGDGTDDPLLRPELDEPEVDEVEPDLDEPEPELVEPELDEPELAFDEPELAFDDPELAVPDEDPVDDDPDDVEAGEDDVPLLCEPGRARVMTPVAATLARLTVAVVVFIRLCPRARAATARRTLSRFGVLIPCSLRPAS